MKKAFTKRFYADKWNIGFVNQTLQDLIKIGGFNSSIKWLPEDSADYSADPFLINENGTSYIYYEELNFLRGKGTISVIKNFDFKTKRNVLGILPSGIHMSYPYLFKDKEQLYCIPETGEIKELGLYKLDLNNPTKLIKERILLIGRAFVDSSMVFYKGKYWLFTSLSQNYKEIYIYYCDSLSGEFIPHSLNPIPVDNSTCRGAGNMVIVNDILYRPTQNNKVRYGGSIVMNRISRLTGTEFHSQPDFELLPDSPYSQGLHNISFDNGIIVIDGKRTQFSLFMPFKRLVRRLRNGS